MLNEHFFDGFLAQVWVKRLPAKRNKLLEGFGELRVLLFFATNDVGQRSANLRESLLEFRHRLFPFIELGRLILEELFQDFHEADRLREIDIENTLPVLHEHSTLRRLIESIGTRITKFELPSNFRIEIVCSVLRFPDTMNQTKAIQNNAIWRDLCATLRLQRELGHESPLVFASFVDDPSAIFQQRLKRSTHGALVCYAKLLELCE